MGQKLSALKSPRSSSPRRQSSDDTAPLPSPGPVTPRSLRDEGLAELFHGEIPRDAAEQLLSTKPQPGTFLIRYSAHMKTYCVSFMKEIDSTTEMPTFAHNLIFHLQNGHYSVVAPEKMTPETTTYPDFVALVRDYQAKGILTESIPRQGTLNREVSMPPGE